MNLINRYLSNEDRETNKETNAANPSCEERPNRT